MPPAGENYSLFHKMPFRLHVCFSLLDPLWEDRKDGSSFCTLSLHKNAHDEEPHLLTGKVRPHLWTVTVLDVFREVCRIVNVFNFSITVAVERILHKNKT